MELSDMSHVTYREWALHKCWWFLLLVLVFIVVVV